MDEALAPERCDDYLARYRSGSAEVAPVIGRDGVAIDPAVRNNTRVMWDDAGEADHLVSSLGAAVPAMCEGGATEFAELDRRIAPRRGRALLFQHRVLHAALAVTRGVKYVLRTDVLCQSQSERA